MVALAAIFVAAYLLWWRKARRVRDPSKASQQDTSDGATVPSSSADVERGEGGQGLPPLAVFVSRAGPAVVSQQSCCCWWPCCCGRCQGNAWCCPTHKLCLKYKLLGRGSKVLG